ncbi:MAG: putative integral membrane protein [Bacteroidetes bacterium HLUCCA01]|nr:MAG: putative integral membrane protein [Bacteroidetes bacterium HLUCCA01]
MQESTALITDSYGLLAVLVLIPATLFYLAENTPLKAFFQKVPVLVFAYVVPSLFVAANIIPSEAPIYSDIMRFVLPASLLLLTLSIDLKGIYNLGPKALLLFFSATAGIVIGGPIALFLFQSYLPEDIWKGFAALAGSWTGGGVNFVAVGVAVGASESMLGMMVIVDVVVAYTWTGLLMFFASRYKRIDAGNQADNSMVERLREKVETFQKETARVSTTSDFMVLIGVAFGAAWLARQIGNWLPPIGGIFDSFAWMIVVVTAFGVILSFTPFRKYEGAGASKLGTLMLYMLIGVIGVKADFTLIAEYPMLIAAGATWMLIHVIIIYLIMRFTRAPLFFMAVGSQANVGGVASAPIVASAFHPALATVGVLLGVAGYVIGTYAGLLTAFLMRLVAGG